ncbi:MAG: molybdopterin-guanine dinucleotide biosynthesis protein B, partial [Nitriliruptorales bacterium]
PAVLRLLAERWQGEAAVVPLVDGRVEPLHGVYARDAALRVRRLLYEGARGVTHAISHLGAVVVGEEEWQAADPDADLRRAR